MYEDDTLPLLQQVPMNARKRYSTPATTNTCECTRTIRYPTLNKHLQIHEGDTLPHPQQVPTNARDQYSPPPSTSTCEYTRAIRYPPPDKNCECTRTLLYPSHNKYLRMYEDDTLFPKPRNRRLEQDLSFSSQV